MEKEEKTNLYLLSIVGIVAIVGIVVLVLNAGTGSMSYDSEDLTGEAIAKAFTAKGFKITCATGYVFDAKKSECVSASVGKISTGTAKTGASADEDCTSPDHMCGYMCCAESQKCETDSDGVEHC